MTSELPSDVWAIVPAGGSGQRFGRHSGNGGKLMAELAGLPVMVHALRALMTIPELETILLVVPADQRESYDKLLSQWIQKDSLFRTFQFINGGSTRRESVYNSLKSVPNHINTVLIHDAARPLLNPRDASRLINHVQVNRGGAVLGAPLTDTVKQVESPSSANQSHESYVSIAQTLNRTLLWSVQTPQVFHRESLLLAHEQIAQDQPITDDAQLIELASLGSVALFEGSKWNLKITTPEDLVLANLLVSSGQCPWLTS